MVVNNACVFARQAEAFQMLPAECKKNIQVSTLAQHQLIEPLMSIPSLEPMWTFYVRADLTAHLHRATAPCNYTASAKG